MIDTNIAVAAARAAHEANRAWCIFNGDTSQVCWDDAPDWQKDSAIIGVQAAASGQSPEQLHESWCNTKLAQGWVYGAEKDAEALTHPCLVPYGALPAEQKAKDHIFSGVVKSFLAAAGL